MFVQRVIGGRMANDDRPTTKHTADLIATPTGVTATGAAGSGSPGRTQARRAVGLCCEVAGLQQLLHTHACATALVGSCHALRYARASTQRVMSNSRGLTALAFLAMLDVAASQHMDTRVASTANARASLQRISEITGVGWIQTRHPPATGECAFARMPDTVLTPRGSCSISNVCPSPWCTFSGRARSTRPRAALPGKLARGGRSTAASGADLEHNSTRLGRPTGSRHLGCRSSMLQWTDSVAD